MCIVAAAYYNASVDSGDGGAEALTGFHQC